MQKEAIVLSLRSGKAWRLASDEGPYLDGRDSAPCPLSFLTTGMVSATTNEILALARQRDILIRDLVLVQDNFYTMEGSALKGTMVGGALPVELEVQIDCDADDGALADMLQQAVQASPFSGLMQKIHRSLFTLTLNDGEIDVGAANALTGSAEADPRDQLATIALGRESNSDECPVVRKKVGNAAENVAGGAGSSLKATQSRKLHIRGTCRLRADGVKEITQELFSPVGSTFQFLCDESEEFGGRRAAPDAVTYVSAGIAFCFMTQLGRYARIMRKNLDHYRVVQDTYFSLGGASGNTGMAGSADAVETHVFLESSESEEFARTALYMGEQTCFLHALCRSDLDTNITLNRIGQ